MKMVEVRGLLEKRKSTHGNNCRGLIMYKDRCRCSDVYWLCVRMTVYW